MTDAVMQKVREVCAQYLQAEQLLPIAEQELVKRKEDAEKAAELASLKAKLEALTAHLDRMYLDKLSGLLAEQDFDRIYRHVREERAALEQRLREREKPDFSLPGKPSWRKRWCIVSSIPRRLTGSCSSASLNGWN